MLRRSLALDAGLFDEEIRRAEDYDLWLRAARRTERMGFHRDILGARRVRGDSLSSDVLAMYEGMAAVLTKLRRLLPLAPLDRAHLEGQLRRTTASVALERGKAQLFEGSTDDAISSFLQANVERKSVKIACVVQCLKIAPRLTCMLVKVWTARIFPTLVQLFHKRKSVRQSLDL
jgi:hypothetical protein